MTYRRVASAVNKQISNLVLLFQSHKNTQVSRNNVLLVATLFFSRISLNTFPFGGKTVYEPLEKGQVSQRR